MSEQYMSHSAMTPELFREAFELWQHLNNTQYQFAVRAGLVYGTSATAMLDQSKKYARLRRLTTRAYNRAARRQQQLELLARYWVGQAKHLATFQR